jgi:hypothetical protein
MLVERGMSAILSLFVGAFPLGRVVEPPQSPGSLATGHKSQRTKEHG